MSTRWRWALLAAGAAGAAVWGLGCAAFVWVTLGPGSDWAAPPGKYLL